MAQWKQLADICQLAVAHLSCFRIPVVKLSQVYTLYTAGSSSQVYAEYVDKLLQQPPQRNPFKHISYGLLV